MLGYITVFFVAALVVTGLVLFLQGFIGKRTAPRRLCMACAFDLAGLTEPEVCPECGAAMGGRFSVRTVTRQRRPGRAWLGLALLAVGLSGPGIMLADSFVAGSLSEHSPAWLLALQLRTLGPHTPRSVTRELVGRGTAKQLSNSTLESLARSIMDLRSGDESLPDEFGLIVGWAADGGLITKDELARHIATEGLLSAQVPERLHVGELLVMNYVVGGGAAMSRLPPDGRWCVGCRIAALEINGHRYESTTANSTEDVRDWTSLTSRTPSMYMGNGLGSYLPRPAVPALPVLPPGTYTLRVHYCIEAFQGRNDQHPGVFNTSRDYRLESFSPEKSLVSLVDDPSWKQQLKDRLRPYVERSSGPGSPDMCWISIAADVKPIPRPSPATDPTLRLGGAWDVFIEIDNQRRGKGIFKLRHDAQGRPTGSAMVEMYRLPKEARRCRVILSPNGHLAAERDAIDAMPAGEIIFEDVPIRN